MVEGGYTEDDLAKEMEEMKKQEDAGAFQKTGGAAADGDGDSEMVGGGVSAPKRRAPPRRKTGSSHLSAFPDPPAE